MGLFQVEAPGDASTRTDAGRGRMHPALSPLRKTSPRSGLWAAGTGAGARPRWASADPQLVRRSPGRTAAPRPERAGSPPARPHPVDPPGSQPDDGRSERAAAELQPGVLTPGRGHREAARGRGGGEEQPRGSPSWTACAARRRLCSSGSASRAAPSRGRVCLALPGPGAPSRRPIPPRHALRELENKKGVHTRSL